MNPWALTSYRDLSATQKVARRAADGLQHAGRLGAMAAVNVGISPIQLARKWRGMETTWLSIDSNYNKRRELRASHGDASELRRVRPKEVAQVLAKMRAPRVKLDALNLTPELVTHLPRSAHEAEYAQPGPEGVGLLGLYFKRKYDANIWHLSTTPETFGRDVTDAITELRTRPGDERHCFNLRVPDDDGITFHTVPVLYCKTGDVEGIIVGDSQGALKYADQIAAMPANAGMNISRTVGLRQVDWFSCHTDAVKFGVTYTGRVRRGDGGHGEFFEPDPIGHAARNPSPSAAANRTSGYLAPPGVVKAGQPTSYVDQHVGKEFDVPLRHDSKGRTLRQFIASHRRMVKVGDGLVERPDYLRQKGFRYAELIQIEAYNQQLLAKLGPDVWTTARQDEFAKEMKAVLRDHSPQRRVEGAAEAPPSALSAAGR